MMDQPRLAPDAQIDLHMHTTYSDGHWAPADLFETLGREGLSLVSVVDHDQLDHLPEVLRLGAERGIAVIPGTEVMTDWHGLAAHMLCYAPIATGFSGDALQGILDDITARMLANTRQVYDTLVAQGYRFPRQAEVLARTGGETRRAVDVMDLLIAHGYAQSQRDALPMVVEAGYRQARAPIGEAIAAAHADGAVCVLAHPGRGEGEIHRYEPDEIEALLREAPLDGVEAYYPTHTPEQVEAYLALARRNRLLVSAGSDSHGPQHRMPIRYPVALAASLLRRLGVAV